MPVVKSHKVLNQGGKHRHLVLGVIVHDLLRQCGLVDLGAVETQLLLHETLLGCLQAAGGNSIVIGRERAVKLKVIAIHSMVRVVGDGIKVVGGGANQTGGGIGQVVRIAEWSIVYGIVDTSQRLSTKKVVERAVLHLQDDDILDTSLQVLDGAVDGGSRRGLCHSREGQQAVECGVVHSEQEGGYSADRCLTFQEPDALTFEAIATLYTVASTRKTPSMLCCRLPRIRTHVL